MSKYLVIVESYSKAPIIQRYLGKDYKVVSSGGHVRDLAKGDQKKAKSTRGKLSDKHKLARKLSVDPYNNWKAHYAILPDKKKLLSQLKKHAQDKATIFLATDLDREGEAIAWHLKESLGSIPADFKRVVFSEITPQAIHRAFAQPRELNMNRVRAQQTRRYLDRVVGFMLSPLLWKKVARGLSAGRVQSVAVRLIVEREHEIQQFIPEEYWQLSAAFVDYDQPPDLQNQDDQDDDTPSFKAKVTHVHQAAYRPTSQQDSAEHVRALTQQTCELHTIDHKKRTLQPSPPFTTSTLQQAASIRLGFGVKRTMGIAQKLYEAGFITYMRTDSTHVSEHAQNQASEFIQANYGSKYLPQTPPKYTSKGNTQEAHESIRPSEVSRQPAEVAHQLTAEQQRLYELIWRRFLASQMSSAQQTTTTYTLGYQSYVLKASAKQLLFDGFHRVLPPTSSQDNLTLPELKQGQQLKISRLFESQHFTKPPPRYSEARFVAELEKRGIGRPSTYVPIISTIQERGYVKLEQRKFYALKMGEIVSEKLTGSFTKIMNYNFTAKMEQDLDEIANGALKWQQILDEFFTDFTQTLDTANTQMLPALPTPIDYPCGLCNSSTTIKTARTGVFLGCASYSSHAQTIKKNATPPCKFTKSLQPAEDFFENSSGELDEDELAAKKLASKKRCPLCQSTMVSYVIDSTTMVHVCARNPTCPGYVMESGKFELKAKDGPTHPCDKCDGTLVLKLGRFGKYYACQSCSNTRKVLSNGEIAPPKADPVHMHELLCQQSAGYFILRDGAAGLFLASSEFPRSRETKAPKVKDLKRHRGELNAKHYFLADAPEQDPAGRDFEIRFARKTKTYFLATEKPKSKSTTSTKSQKSKTPTWIATYNGTSWDLKKDALRTTKRRPAKSSSST